MPLRALLIATVLAVVGPAGPSKAQTETVIWGCDGIGYAEETQVYRHGVLGDDIEYKALVARDNEAPNGLRVIHRLPLGDVFEDTAPRCADLDGDGSPEIITVVSNATVGARLAIYDATRRITSTPPIGRGFRWLAPIGTGDLNGDGRIEVAYVETPHIGGTIRVWALRDQDLIHVASGFGFSNHRIGEPTITGGVRTCANRDEMVVPSFDWTELRTARVVANRVVYNTISDRTDASAVAAALACTVN